MQGALIYVEKRTGKRRQRRKKREKKREGGAEKNILLNDSFLCKHDPV